MLQKYANGQVDELVLAEFLGLDVSTDKAKMMAISSIRNMDIRSQKTASQKVSATVFKGATLVTGNGRIQIPVKIREALGLVDGDLGLWYEIDGFYILSKEQIDSKWMQGNYTFRSTRPTSG